MKFGVGAGEEREARMPTEAIWVVVAWDIPGQGIACRAVVERMAKYRFDNGVAPAELYRHGPELLKVVFA